MKVAARWHPHYKAAGNGVAVKLSSVYWFPAPQQAPGNGAGVERSCQCTGASPLTKPPYGRKRGSRSSDKTAPPRLLLDPTLNSSFGQHGIQRFPCLMAAGPLSPLCLSINQYLGLCFCLSVRWCGEQKETREVIELIQIDFTFLTKR